MTNENHVVWLRLVDAGTDNECWFVCNRCDPGAIPFIPESEITRPAEVGGDGERLDQLERMVGELGMLLLHHGAGAGKNITGLGLSNTGRSLRQAIDETMLPAPGSEAKS